MRVLFGTDGYAPSLDAGRLIRKLGGRDRVEITVLCVEEPWARWSGDEYSQRLLDLPVDGAEEIAKAEAERLTDAGFRARWEIAEGSPGAKIVRAVEQESYDLAIVGAGRRSWLGNLLLGSVSTHVLHSSHSSVLVVHETVDMDERGRILLGVDGSAGARLATQVVARFADPSSTGVDVLEVVHLPEPFVIPAPGVLYPDSSYVHHMVEKAERDSAAAVATLRLAGFDAHGAVTTAHPVTGILKEAENDRADLIAVGSRGLGPLGRGLLGSVSDHIARHGPAGLVARRLKT